MYKISLVFLVRLVGFGQFGHIPTTTTTTFPLLLPAQSFIILLSSLLPIDPSRSDTENLNRQSFVCRT